MCVLGRYQPIMEGRNRPILLKKSGMVSPAERYVLEIEIFTFNRGFWAQISRSSAQKRCFQRSVCEQSGGTDFFNRIDPKLMVATGRNRPFADMPLLSITVR
jgi:hypothetical protein